MIDRVLKNWKTTVIGLAILAVCFCLVFMGKASLTEVGGFICGGFYVLFSKDSLLKKRGILLAVVGMMIVPMVAGCRTYRSFTKEREVVQLDTIREVDSVYVRIVVPGDTVVKIGERILVDTVEVEKFREGRFSLQPWDTCTRYAYARAGITGNIPWLLLEQRGITVDTNIYVERLRIMEKRLREMSRQVEKTEIFFENEWFWIAVCLGLLNVVLFARNAQHKD